LRANSQSRQNLTLYSIALYFQIELALKGLYPYCTVVPFGSSVNGFGHTNSDLDMIIELEKETNNYAHKALVSAMNII